MKVQDVFKLACEKRIYKIKRKGYTAYTIKGYGIKEFIYKHLREVEIFADDWEVENEIIVNMGQDGRLIYNDSLMGLFIPKGSTVIIKLEEQ